MSETDMQPSKQLKRFAPADTDCQRKRPKTGCVEKSHDTTLVDDVLSIVLAMLPPREMLRLASCSKFLMSILSRERVMYNSILSGGHAMMSMKHMTNLMEEEKIHFPSPMRLLRLANGLRCELPKCMNTVHTIRPHLGLFVCWPCFTKSDAAHQVSTSSRRWNEDRTLQQIVEHRKTAHYTYLRKHFIWSKTFETASGEKAGPLVTMENINDVISNQVPLEDFFRSLDRKNPKPLVQSLLAVCKQAFQKASLNEKEDMSLREARVQKFRKSKAEKLEEKLNKIKEMLDPRWRPFALRIWWESSNGRSRQHEDEYNPKFESSLVRGIAGLASLARAPAKGSQKKLIRMADAVDKVFEPIFDSGIHDFSFLSSDYSTNPFEASLRVGLQRRYDCENFVLSLEEEDVNRLQCHGPLLALALKLSNEKHCLWKPPGCFAVSVLASANVEDPLDTDEMFAKVLWSMYVPTKEWEADLSFSDTCNQVFKRTLSAFLRIRGRILHYIHHHETVAFLNSQDGRNPEWLRVKREEIEKVWVDKEILRQFVREEVDFRTLRRNQVSNAQRRWLGGRW